MTNNEEMYALTLVYQSKDGVIQQANAFAATSVELSKMASEMRRKLESTGQVFLYSSVERVEEEGDFCEELNYSEEIVYH